MTENRPSTVNELFPSRFICPEDLNGKSYTLKIREVQVEKMRSKFTNRDEWKAVVYFERAQKGLVLNVTRAKALEKITGSGHFKDWIGYKVMIYAGTYRKKRTIFIKDHPQEGLDNYFIPE